MARDIRPYQHVSRGRWTQRYIFLRQFGNKRGSIIFLLLQNNNTDPTHSIRLGKQKPTKKRQRLCFWEQAAGVTPGNAPEGLSPASHTLTDLLAHGRLKKDMAIPPHASFFQAEPPRVAREVLLLSKTPRNIETATEGLRNSRCQNPSVQAARV